MQDDGFSVDSVTQDMRDLDEAVHAANREQEFRPSHNLPAHWAEALPQLDAFKDEVRFLESILTHWPPQQAERFRGEYMKAYMDMLNSNGMRGFGAPTGPPLNLRDLSINTSNSILEMMVGFYGLFRIYIFADAAHNPNISPRHFHPVYSPHNPVPMPIPTCSFAPCLNTPGYVYCAPTMG